MKLDEILAKRGKQVEDIRQIYYGKDHCCRCGCKGNYADAGTPLFKRYLKKLMASEAQGIIEWSPQPYGTCWLNIPVDSARDMCYCLYFED